MLEFEDLTDVNLIGHSYGGMVATGVADRAAERIARAYYWGTHFEISADTWPADVTVSLFCMPPAAEFSAAARLSAADPTLRLLDRVALAFKARLRARAAARPGTAWALPGPAARCTPTRLARRGGRRPGN